MKLNSQALKRAVQAVIILGFIVVTFVVTLLLYATRPIAVAKKDIITDPAVEFLVVKKKPYSIEVATQGLVQPKRRARLAVELSGKVTWLSDQFVTGGRFKEGEDILRLDASDYEAAVAQSHAQLAEAESVLASEKARGEQARRDWERLGQGKASDLTLRIPQIKSAESRVEAARAAYEKAQRDLAKTKVKAPFDATVVAKSTELGNYITPGGPIGEFFQTTPLEVRVPLSLDELPFLETDTHGNIGGKLTLTTRMGGRAMSWPAVIVRTEGQVDPASRSIYLICEVDPSREWAGAIRLQPGLFLEATIAGRNFKNVAKIPLRAFHDLNTVVLVDKEDKLEFRTVEVLRRSGDFAFVSEGLEDGERVCLTELSTMVEGITVQPRQVNSGDADREMLSDKL